MKNFNWYEDWRTLSGSINIDFWCDTGRVRKTSESTDPSSLVSTVQSAGGVGDVFVAHFGPNSTNRPSLYDHSLQQDNKLCHEAQIVSNYFLEHENYTQMPHSHQMLILYSSFGMRWNGRLASWVIQHLCDADKSMWTKNSEKGFSFQEQLRRSNPVLARCT